MQNETLLLTGKIKKIAWQFAIPSIISMVVFALYNIVDRIFIGNIPGIGSIAMTGVGLTAPVTTAVFALVMLVGAGSATLISLRLGEKKAAEANLVFNNAMEMILVGSAIVMVGLWFLLKPILRGLGVDEVAMPFAFDYLVILIGGFLFNGTSFFLCGALRAAGHPQISTVCNVIGTVLNILLDWWFIFGLGWGIAGAAWATIISQLVALLVVGGFYYGKRSKLVLKIKKPNWRIDKRIMTKIIKIGFAPCMVQLANCVVLILMNGMLLKYGGNLAVAAMTIIFSIQNLVFLPMIGFIQGQQPIIGFNYGAKAFGRVRELMRYCFGIALVFGLAALILVEVFPEVVIRIFSQDQELIEMTTHGIRIFQAMALFLGVQILSANYFQYVGKARWASILGMLRQVIAFIPLLLILPRFWGLEGVWWAAPIGDLIATVVTLIVFIREYKKLPKTNQNRPDEIILDKVENRVEAGLAVEPIVEGAEELTGI